MIRVVVIGAGPAGMAAANAAAVAGVDVLLIDAEPRLGGQYHRQAAGAAERFALAPGVEHLAESVVWAIEPISGGHRVHVTTGPADGPGRTGRAVDTAALVLATGAHDRALPFPGWDLPGVVTAGAAQALAKGQGVAIGERVLLAGTGPFLLPVAKSLLDVGAEVTQVLEANTVMTGWLRPGDPGGDTRVRRGRHAARPDRRPTAAGASAADDEATRADSAGDDRTAMGVDGDDTTRTGVPAAAPPGRGTDDGVSDSAVPAGTVDRPGRTAARAVDWSRRLGGALASPGKARELAGYLTLLARHRIPYRSRHTVIAAHGHDRVEAATIARLDANWRVVPGSQRDVDVDAVCVGFGFTPQLELATAVGCELADGFVTVDIAQSTSVPGVFAAGELTGVGGAVLSEHEGTVAGTAAAIWLGARAERPATALRKVRAGRRFAAALAAAYPIRSGWTSWLTDDTLVCRCEEVTRGQLRAAVDEHHATGVRTVKLISRAGLGRCQGRICGRNVAELASLPDPGAAFARRPIAVPIRLGELAEPDHPNSHEGTA